MERCPGHDCETVGSLGFDIAPDNQYSVTYICIFRRQAGTLIYSVASRERVVPQWTHEGVR